MHKFIHYLVYSYLKSFHNYDISLELSAGKTILVVHFQPFFIFKNIYCKQTIDLEVEKRLKKYYADISDVKYVYYVNKYTGRVDKFRSKFSIV